PPGGHHITAPVWWRPISLLFIIKKEGRGFPHDWRARKLSARHPRGAIIDVCKLRTKTADIDWKFSRKFSGLTAELVKHGQYLLCFAQREHRYEDACPVRESVLECPGEPSLFTGACPARRVRVIASRAFHDQDIDLFFRKNRRFHDCLIVEIDVSGVKDGLTLGAQQNSCRAEHMPCVEELER